jgi:uncharacterized protein YlxW (UPF0749 family)
VEEINDALDVPLQQKKTELSILEAEKVERKDLVVFFFFFFFFFFFLFCCVFFFFFFSQNAVASRMNLFRDEKTKQIEVSREKVAELSNREQELLAELAKVRKKKEKKKCLILFCFR